jgi:hypothetical protein
MYEWVSEIIGQGVSGTTSYRALERSGLLCLKHLPALCIAFERVLLRLDAS